MVPSARRLCLSKSRSRATLDLLRIASASGEKTGFPASAERAIRIVRTHQITAWRAVPSSGRDYSISMPATSSCVRPCLRLASCSAAARLESSSADALRLIALAIAITASHWSRASSEAVKNEPKGSKPQRRLRPAHLRRHQYVTCYTEGFSHFVTSMTAPVASGWSGCRAGAHTHWKAPPSHGAHVNRSFGISAVDGASWWNRPLALSVVGRAASPGAVPASSSPRAVSECSADFNFNRARRSPW